tara:strand:+ start:2125 stop:3741 length:1617 start_codon:yes stop_codon:yes gene_type:complete
MAVYHRSKRLKIYGKKPEVTQLFGDRYAMTVRCVAKNDTEAWYNKNKDQIFADFGTLYDAHMSVDGIDARAGEAYSNMILISVGASYTQTGDYVITFEYQTLTDSFVQEAADKVDVELNGLRRVTRPLIAKDGTTYGKIVGTTTLSHSGIGYSTATLTLARAISGQKDPDESGYVRITETWLESGVISRSINEGRGGADSTGHIRTEVVEAFNETPTSSISGVEIGVSTSNVEGIDTIRKTFVSSSGEIRRTSRPGPDAIPNTTFVTIESVGTAISPSGTLINSSETQENGYVRFSRTCLQGTIAKTTQTYQDVVFVDVPGEVTIDTVSASFDQISDEIDGQRPTGDSVVIESIPPKKKQIVATVTVKIQSSIPDTTELAFDISGLSCSVIKVTSSNSGKVGRAVTLVDAQGNTTTQVGKGASFSTSSSILEFPRHFIVTGGESASASVSGSMSRQPYIAGDAFKFQTAKSGTFTQAFAFGNNETDKNTLYKTTGVISKRFRPVLTAQDGTVFYEVTTVSVAGSPTGSNGLPLGRLIV